MMMSGFFAMGASSNIDAADGSDPQHGRPDYGLNAYRVVFHVAGTYCAGIFLVRLSQASRITPYRIPAMKLTGSSNPEALLERETRR